VSMVRPEMTNVGSWGGGACIVLEEERLRVRGQLFINRDLTFSGH
jgi:hypothetical protein